MKAAPAFILMILGSAVCAGAADFSRVPGVVIAHSPQSSGIYLGTPGIVILGDGACIAKCDEFGPKSTETTRGVTHVFRSEDHGKTWRKIATVQGLYWSNLFVHRDALITGSSTPISCSMETIWPPCIAPPSMMAKAAPVTSTIPT